MSQFVSYSKSLMEAAKGFRNHGLSCGNDEARQAFYRASIFHAFSFLELHLNYIADHFQGSTMFSIHEKGILLEREVAFEAGIFRIRPRSKFYRMSDRMN